MIVNDNPDDAEATSTNSPGEHFKQQSEKPEVGFFLEFWDFLRHNKKWWLIPLLLSLLLVSALALLGNSPLAPFIYSLF